MDRTTPQDVCRMPLPHVQRICVLRMGHQGHLRKATRGVSLRLAADPVAILVKSARFVFHMEQGSLLLPILSVDRALANKHCPDLIMHPQPVSEVNPCLSAKLRIRTESVIEASGDFMIGGKFERYVSQMRASQSSRKSAGQPLSMSPSSGLETVMPSANPFICTCCGIRTPASPLSPVAAIFSSPGGRSPLKEVS